MDTTTQMLIGSLVMNALLILKECVSRMSKSSCCGSEIVFTSPIQRRKKEIINKDPPKENKVEMIV